MPSKLEKHRLYVDFICCNILFLHNRSSYHRNRSHFYDPDGFSEQPILRK